MNAILKVVVTGEVDAGKSSLIGRLLFDTGSLSKEVMCQITRDGGINSGAPEFAYLLDGLEEERKGGLTIDTTQVFCRNGKSGFLFIDVPGHSELLKNMLCGSSYSQAAILVTDVNKPLESGTIRHIKVLKFLGIERVVVVLNKMDICHFSKDVFERAQNKIFNFIVSMGMKAEYFIPASALKGYNLAKKSDKIPWYRGPCLIAALDALAGLIKKREGSEFYFPIQDVYMIRGKPVFVGTISAGKIRKNDLIRISPEGGRDRISAIKVFGKNKLSAQAPESIGLELTSRQDLKRGQLIYKDDRLKPCLEIAVKMLCVQPVSLQDELFFSCSTQQTLCSIKQIDKISSLMDQVTCYGKSNFDKPDILEAVIVMQSPVVITRFCQVEALGRFVLRKGKEICAVGIIP